MLTGFMNRPTSDEIRDFKNGVAQFALLEGETCPVLCFRMGAQPWSDAPWEAWRQPSGTGLPAPGANALQVALCDTAGGIVKSLRLVGLKTEFAAELHRIATRLTTQAATPEQSTAELNAFMRQPTAQLLTMAQFHN